MTTTLLDNFDGTFTDKASGLTWMNFAMGQEVSPHSHPLGNPKRDCCKNSLFKWHQASQIGRGLSSSIEWRLPSKDELASLVASFELISGPTGIYWTSTPSDSGGFWGVNFDFDSSYKFCTGCINQTWLVRLVSGQNTSNFKPVEIEKTGYAELAERYSKSSVSQFLSVFWSDNDQIERERDFWIATIQRVCDVVNHAIENSMYFVDTETNSRFIKMMSNSLEHPYWGISNEELRSSYEAMARVVFTNSEIKDGFFSAFCETAKNDIKNDNYLLWHDDLIGLLEALARSEQWNDVSDRYIAAINVEANFIQAAKIESLEAELVQLREQLASKGKAPFVPEINANLGGDVFKCKTIHDILGWLATQTETPQSELRRHLLPLDLLPSAFMDGINETAIDLTGEVALEEDGDSIIVNQEVLLQVIRQY